MKNIFVYTTKTMFKWKKKSIWKINIFHFRNVLTILFLWLNTYIFVLKINIIRGDKHTDHVSNKIKKEIFNAFFKHVLCLFYTINKIWIKVYSVDILNIK